MSTQYYELQARVEERFNALQTQQNAAQHIFDELEALRLDDVVEPMSATDSVIEAKDVIGEALLQWGSVCDESRTGLLQPAFEAVTSGFQTGSELVRARQDQWQADAQSLAEGVQEAGTQHVAARDREIQEYGEFTATIQQLAEQFAEGFGNMQTALQQMTDKTAESLRPAYVETLNAFDTAVQHLKDVDLTQGEGTHRDVVQAAVDEFSDAVETVASSYASLAQDLLGSATGRVEQEMSAAWERKVSDLKDSILTSLAEEVVEGIGETQLSVAISGALTPIMPQLIAIYKALDALEDAIRVWKDVKKVFGF